MQRRVRDLMTEHVFAVGPGDDLGAVTQVLEDHDVRHVPVVDSESRLVGILSQRDLIRYAASGDDRDVVEARLESTTVADLMSAPETVAEETPLAEAAEIMLENKFGCLPVVRGDVLVGIVTEADFVREVMRFEGGE